MCGYDCGGEGKWEIGEGRRVRVVILVHVASVMRVELVYKLVLTNTPGNF